MAIREREKRCVREAGAVAPLPPVTKKFGGGATPSCHRGGAQRAFPFHPLMKLKSFRFVLLTGVALLAAHAMCAADARPNVLWFIVDDMSANFSCYGETAIATPNVDRLAREGTRFSGAFTTAPVCSPCRSAFITGMY